MSAGFFDKKEVACWLKRYVMFSNYVQCNIDRPIKELFEEFAKNNDIEEPYYEAYTTMCKMNLLYSNLTIFSYLYDVANAYWLASEIEDAIKDKPEEYGRLNKIFLDGNGKKSFTRKTLIDIRNALNHCENKELFKIAKDCNSIEINSQNGGFNVKIDTYDLAALIKIAMENMRNNPLSSFENEGRLDYSSFSSLQKTLYSEFRYCRVFNRKKFETRFEELMKRSSDPNEVEEFLNVLKKFDGIELKKKSKRLSRSQLDMIMDIVSV